MFKVYCAAPITGRSYAEVTDYYRDLKTKLESWGLAVICPMSGKAHLRTETKFEATGYNHPVSTDHAIIERDRWMVSRSDVVYVNLMNAKKVSIGCMMEMAWAHDRGVHVVVAMEPDNCHRHAFVLEAADIVFDNDADAMNYLRSLGLGEI